MGAIFYGIDGELTTYNFTLHKEPKINEWSCEMNFERVLMGEIQVGGLRNGDTMTSNDEGMYFFYQDGTRYFISWNWFK